MASVEAELRAENERLRAEQRTTAEILRVVNESAGSLDIALQAIADAAVHLCGADAARVRLWNGTYLIDGPASGPDTYVEIARPPGTRMVLVTQQPAAVAIRERKSVHTPDVLRQMDETGAEPEAIDYVRASRSRTMLNIPIQGDGTVLAILTLNRLHQVRPFSDDEIALAETFAAQAAIAMSNSRRMDALREALEQQTATSEILSIISSSPTDLQPVFQAVVERAKRLSNSDTAGLRLRDGDRLRLVADVGESVAAAIKLPIGHEITLMRRTPMVISVLEDRSLQASGTPEDIEEAYPDMAASWREAGFERRTQLSVPLSCDGAALGALGVGRSDGLPFTERQVALLETFAAQVVIAMQNTRLFNDLRDALEQQTATSEILSIISSSPTDLQPVFQAVAERTQLLLGADTGSVTLYEGDSGHMVAEVGATPGATLQLPIPRTYSLLREDSPSLQALLTGRTMHTFGTPDEVQEDAPRLADLWRRAGYERRTVLRVPLVHETVVLGVIRAGRADGMPFTDRQVALLETFAAQVVIAMQNTRLFNELELRNTELGAALGRQTAMSEVLQLISRSPTDVQPVFDAIVERSARLCGATGCRLWLADGNSFRWVALWGHRTEDTEARPTSAIADAELAGFFRSIGEALQFRFYGPDNVVVERGHPDWNYYQQSDGAGNFNRGMRAGLFVPLRRGDATIGMLTMSLTDERSFVDQDVALVETFADQAVIAIENARLFNELELRNKELAVALEQQRAMSSILEAISTTPGDQQTALDAVAESAVRFCGLGIAAIYTAHEDQLTFAAGYATPGLRPGWEGRLRLDGSIPPAVAISRRSVSGRALLDRHPVQSPDLQTDDDFPDGQQLAQAYGYHTTLAVPLLRGDAPIGSLTVNQGETRSFTDEQVRLLEVFARQAVVAIENARLFAELEQRNKDLAESLAQQTATAEVLGVISRAPVELRSVFEVIVERAARLLQAEQAFLRQLVDGSLVMVAGWRDGRIRANLESVLPFELSNRDSLNVLAVSDRNTVHRYGGPASIANELPSVAHAWQRDGIGSAVTVPLLSAETVFGSVMVRRRATEPFTAGQVKLLETFADQAVIAIENVRLFEEIQQKTRQLEAANAAKSQFLSTMSHELRTPLNAVIGYSELLAEDAADGGHDDMVPDLVRINAAGKHLLSLINNVLDISKIEAGKMELELQDFAIGDVLAEVEAVVPPLMSRNSNSFELDASTDLGGMHSDKTKLRQCLLNLLSNAAKFTEQGTVTLTVGRSLDEGDDRLTFTVADTGIGMSEEQQGRLFQSFTQAEAGTASRYGGTGLGLALSREFARLMGGDITVESDLGTGSIFTLTLPATVTASLLPQP